MFIKGKILGYNKENDIGHISYDDIRLEFTIDDWLGDNAPVNGMEVDFVKNNNNATEIYILPKPQESLNKPDTSNIKQLYYGYLAGTIIPLISIITVFISYSYKRSSTQDNVLHYEYQIKTFWRHFHYLIIAAILIISGSKGHSFMEGIASLTGLILIVYAFVFNIRRNANGIASLDKANTLDFYLMDLYYLAKLDKIFNKMKEYI